jgi:hypothetical protein
VLAASTYPLEIVQAHRWLKANTALKGEALTEAAARQPCGIPACNPRGLSRRSQAPR